MQFSPTEEVIVKLEVNEEDSEIFAPDHFLAQSFPATLVPLSTPKQNIAIRQDLISPGGLRQDLIRQVNRQDNIRQDTMRKNVITQNNITQDAERQDNRQVAIRNDNIILKQDVNTRQDLNARQESNTRLINKEIPYTKKRKPSESLGDSTARESEFSCEDSFEAFGRYIVTSLRELPRGVAIDLQCEFQRMLALQQMKYLVGKSAEDGSCREGPVDQGFVAVKTEPLSDL